MAISEPCHELFLAQAFGRSCHPDRRLRAQLQTLHHGHLIPPSGDLFFIYRKPEPSPLVQQPFEAKEAINPKQIRRFESDGSGEPSLSLCVLCPIGVACSEAFHFGPVGFSIDLLEDTAPQQEHEIVAAGWETQIHASFVKDRRFEPGASEGQQWPDGIVGS